MQGLVVDPDVAGIRVVACIVLDLGYNMLRLDSANLGGTHLGGEDAEQNAEVIGREARALGIDVALKRLSISTATLSSDAAITPLVRTLP